MPEGTGQATCFNAWPRMVDGIVLEARERREAVQDRDVLEHLLHHVAVRVQGERHLSVAFFSTVMVVVKPQAPECTINCGHDLLFSLRQMSTRSREAPGKDGLPAPATYYHQEGFR